jgi:hypothetical protein
MSNAHIQIRDGWALIDGQPEPYLQWLRGTRNKQPWPAGRAPWPEGKAAFGEFVTREGGRAPHIVARIEQGRVVASPYGTGDSVADLLKKLPDGSYFCKPDLGGNGIGALRLEITGGRATVPGEPLSAGEIAAKLASEAYVLQTSLVPYQHPDIARFSPGAINTLRLVTFADENGALGAAAALRISANGVAVDNWSAGGVVVPIDPERGTLGPLGIVKKTLTLIDRHPDTGLSFAGQPVPHFRDALAMAGQLHEKLAVATLGWDIALLESGPCILEANRRWDIFLSAQFNPDFATNLLAFHLPGPADDSIRLTLEGDFADVATIRLVLCAMLGKSGASGRVDAFTPQRLELTVSGPASVVEAALKRLKKTAVQFGARRMTAARGGDLPAPGLDIGATFSPDAALAAQ